MCSKELGISIIKEYMLLKTVPYIKDTMFFNILEKRGTLKNIFSASFDELYALGIPDTAAENIIKKKYNEAFVDKELSMAEKNNVQLICLEDSRYPAMLKEIYCPPAYLYVKGSLEHLTKPTIAIVGSRKASKASTDFAYAIASDLASVGITVVSGFASGIDIAAHTGAMTKGSTAAVLGSGLSNIYPKKNLKYASELIEKGCFISEYRFYEEPLPYNFPKRNRIISGLSMGVLIVEAAFRSGSLITARFALEQNRSVFAVPQFPGAYHSATNNLIKQGAKLTESYRDIIEEFENLLYVQFMADNSKPAAMPNGIKGKICNAILKEPCSADELCIMLNVNAADLMIYTAELEMDSYITKNEGNKYIPSKGLING